MTSDSHMVLGTMLSSDFSHTVLETISFSADVNLSFDTFSLIFHMQNCRKEHLVQELHAPSWIVQPMARVLYQVVAQ